MGSPVLSAGYDGYVPIRVLSVPSGHVYVRHLSTPESDGVVRLPDPPTPADAAGAPWWPPQALDPGWLREHAGDFDLAHVHFGFDGRGAEELSEWTGELRRLGKPLVYTAHDLRNPHHDDPEPHAAALDVLVPAADALVTLTPGAAAEIEERWGRRALVLPHPHVVPLERVGKPRPRREDFVVGVHLKSLRAGMDPAPVVRLLGKLVPTLPEARLRLDVHTDVVTPGTPRHDAGMTALLHEVAGVDGVELVVHDFFSDDELWDYLTALDLSVLPYRHGTHSGWLEACHDLGTTVLAPDCGYYAEQRPCLSFALTDEGVDEVGLETAVREAHGDRPCWQATSAERRDERRLLDRAHQRLYAGLLQQ